MIEVRKNIATVIMSDPEAVKREVEKKGHSYHSGAIFVDCRELELSPLYCRYGLSIPYIRIKEGGRVLIEPTIEDKERWFYTGLVDCGYETINPTARDVFMTQVIDGKYEIHIGNSIKFEGDSVSSIHKVTIGSFVMNINGTTPEIRIGSTSAHEAFILGNSAKIEFEKDRDALRELQTALAAWTPVAMDGGAALKTALAPFLSKVMANYDNILSETIKGK